MKGQYLTVEYMLFFAIGIAMVIAVYFTFSGIGDNVKANTAKSQIARTGELIRTSIIKVFETANETNSTISYTVQIPTKISGCIYLITANGNFLNLNCSSPPFSASVSLYGINTKTENIIYSTSGRVNITSSGGGVVLS
jgi:hypothetical protein